LRLSTIKLAGFKSFIDPTEIPVPGSLIGIVGPNGCGKSNVIDAIRWVLGESRASALRGNSMQDVIFNGSGSRKAVGRASVELTFDNSLGKAAGQWSSYAEICIKRILHRDGESTYHINNIHVRRRDVADIFLGTGVGGRGYAIVEQGTISRVIEAKPEELRIFLEEAAGISKYRDRRRETELRLAGTRENLLRVCDISLELEKQLLRLEEQAETASRFNAMKTELERAQHLFWWGRKQEAAAQRMRAETELKSLQVALEVETANLRDAEKRLEERRATHLTMGDSVHQAQGELYAANSEAAHLEQQIQHVRENRRRMTQQVTTVRAHLEQCQAQAAETASSLEHWRAERASAQLVRESTKRKTASENKKLFRAESAFRLCQEKFFETQRSMVLAEQAEKLEESHRAHAHGTVRQLESRRTRLLAELESLQQPDFEKLSGFQQEIENVAIALKQKQEALGQTESMRLSAEKTKQDLIRRTQAIDQEIVRMEARLHALERLQQKIETSEALGTWLVKHQLDASPRLWQVIEIENGWEDALEAVLHDRLNSTEVKQLSAAGSWAEDAPPGKWTLFESEKFREEEGPLRNQPSGKSKEWKPLQGYLTCRSREIECMLREWLNGIFAVENLREGHLQRANLATGEMLVTREGHLFTQHSLSYYAPDSQLHGVLARQREIGQIKIEIGELTSKLSTEQSALEAAQQRWKGLETSMSALRSEVVQFQQQHHDAQLQALKLAQLTERASHRRNQIDIELSEILQQEETETSRAKEIENKLAGYRAQIRSLQEQAQAEKLASTAAEKSLATQRRLVQDAATEMQETAFFEQTCQHKIDELKNSRQGIDESIKGYTANLNDLLAEQDSFDEAPTNILLQKCIIRREQKERELVAARTELEDSLDHLRAIEQQRMVSEQKLDPLRESINSARLREQEARITENQLGEQLKETGADEAELDRNGEKRRLSALQAEITRLTLGMAALGAVNLAALEELESSRARKKYLDAQSHDLGEAVETLESVIRRIDRETRERLLETVEKVNGHLQEMFPTMFGGGEAKLILIGTEILDSGVQIFAQPPGKKNSSIHLLSGGEKALTALALVFSLFQLNPAPFCLLDEVDAPLDDTNTERFCNLVKKMSRQIQFLFISHNKITMEMAQQLIGVTMQEQGVSRVVTVEIEEAVRLSEAAMVG
jgi:chromosome segregation protein